MRIDFFDMEPPGCEPLGCTESGGGSRDWRGGKTEKERKKETVTQSSRRAGHRERRNLRRGCDCAGCAVDRSKRDFSHPQADRFIRMNRKDKTSACSVRNDRLVVGGREWNDLSASYSAKKHILLRKPMAGVGLHQQSQCDGCCEEGCQRQFL